MPIYFISDLHLEESRPDITQAFLQYMDAAQKDATALYILGDFFESWIGDDENTELQLSIKKRLKSFTDSGPALFFMHGNRDFLIGALFAEETGATILPDPSIIQLNNEPVLLMHGDSLCTGDTGYMKFRATIRNPSFLEPLLKRPIEERKITAQQLRAMSQANNQSKSTEIMDVTPEEVTAEMSKHQIKTLIHGHTHRPEIHNIEVDQQPAQRIVIGDWDKEVWYLKVEEDQPIALLHYPLTQPNTTL
jgi:UDP-2,3-diacylglucosamine hydrolase